MAATYENSKRGTPRFNPDGRHVLSAGRGQGPGTETVVIVGRPGDRYDDVLPLYGYIVFDSARSFHYLARRGTSWLLVEETLDD